MSLRWRLLIVVAVVGPALLWVGGIGRGGGATPASPPTSTTPTDPPGVGVDAAADVDIEAKTVIKPTTRPRSDASDAEAAAIQQQVRSTIERNGWTTAEAIATGGYQPMAGDPTHWYRPESLADEALVDPSDPEFLVVLDGRAVAVMFVTSDESPPDPPGAPLAEWHRHEWSAPVCLEDGLVVVGIAGDEPCPDGARASTVSPWMFHVWLDADDPFASEMDGSGHQH